MSSLNKTSGSKSACEKSGSRDKISELPGCILEQILSLLSIKEMVRTSVLSKKWRFKWATVPSLKFDNHSFSQSSDGHARVIDHILLLHLGPVHMFKLDAYRNIPYKELDKWILYISRHSIKDLRLNVCNSSNYRIPSCLFSCQGLTHLNLSYCSLSLPSSFEGFVNLKSLTLTAVRIVQQDLENLVSSSRVLERLTVDHVSNIDQLNINAPTLLFLKIDGKFVDVRFKGVSRLIETHLITESSNERLPLESPEKYGDLTKLMAGIPQISHLKFGYYQTVYMSAGNIPRKLPVLLVNLTSLSIRLLFACFKEVSVLRCFLRSAPNLKELHISPLPIDLAEASGVLKWDPTCWEVPFTHLRFVNIDYFMGEKEDMDFVEYLLLNTPALQSMTIEVDECLSGDTYSAMENEMLKKMLRFKRTSPEAKINIRYDT